MRLRIEDLACGYPNKTLVEHIDFSLSEGEIVCVLGPNGVGKTTFFRTVLGFLPRKAGGIYLDDREISTFTTRQLAREVAYVPQTKSPAFEFRVREVVAMGCTPALKPFAVPSQKDYLFCDEILDRLKILHLRDRIFNELSGGEAQMVLIARALAQQPRLLMMDEPTSNLDFGNQVRMLQCICQLAEDGIGIIMTTHFPDHAFLCSTKVALFTQEKGCVYGDADEVLTAQSLSEAYHVEVCLTRSVTPDGKTIKTCTPYLSAGHADTSV
ncbi:MAG: ABC transporter ATP-binding protein [Lachnospiraceae bacterium]|nr:ABC transporter ATP-binding protein [Lachnospiraceae bacterium]